MNGSCQTTSDNIDLPTRGSLRGILKGEPGGPEETLDDSLLEMRGILGNLCLEPLDYMIRIVERTADHGFCTIHEAMKAISGLLPIVGANMANIAIVEGGGDKIDVSIQKIDTLLLNREPCAAIDPGSPPSQISHGRVGSIIDAGGNSTNMVNIQRPLLVIVKADINIGVWSLRTTRI